MKYSLDNENGKILLKSTKTALTFKEYEKEVILYGAYTIGSLELLYTIGLAQAVYEEQAERYFDDLIYISTNYPNIESICSLFPNMDKTIYNINGDEYYCFKLVQYDEIREYKARTICRNITPEMIRRSLPHYKRLFLAPIVDDCDKLNVYEALGNYGIYIKAGIGNRFTNTSTHHNNSILEDAIEHFNLDFSTSGINYMLKDIADGYITGSDKETREEMTYNTDSYIRHCLLIPDGKSISTTKEGIKSTLRIYEGKIKIPTFVMDILMYTLYDNPETLTSILMESTSEIAQSKAGEQILSYICNILLGDKTYRKADTSKMIDSIYGINPAKRITIKRASTGRTVTMQV